MTAIFHTITMTDLQRRAKDAFSEVKDYAIIRSHDRDIALVLNPKLGRLLVESGMLRKLLEEYAEKERQAQSVDMDNLDQLIGNVIQELSKR